MPVRKRGDRWHVRFQVDGHRVETTAGKGASRADAVALEAKLRADILAGRLGRAPNRTVEEALVKWLTEYAPRLKSYRSLLSKVNQIEPHLKGARLDQITQVAERVRNAGAGKEPGTINRQLAILRRVAKLAFNEWNWLTIDLGSRIKMVPGERSRETYLTEEEANRLIDCCAHDRVKDAIRLGLLTGLRQGEILRLSPANRIAGLLVLDSLTKNARSRAVPDPGIELPLRVTYSTLRTYFERARKAAGLAHVRWHDLRHTTASWILQQGGPMVLVRDLLGHSSLAVTSKYAHLQRGGISEAARFLPRQLGKPSRNVTEEEDEKPHE